jgi:hypothetical protein
MFCRFIVARVPDRVGMRHPHFRSGDCFADASANPRPGPTGTSYKLIAVVQRIGNQTPLQRLKPASIRRFGRADGSGDSPQEPGPPERCKHSARGGTYSTIDNSRSVTLASRQYWSGALR